MVRIRDHPKRGVVMGIVEDYSSANRAILEDISMPTPTKKAALKGKKKEELEQEIEDIEEEELEEEDEEDEEDEEEEDEPVAKKKAKKKAAVVEEDEEEEEEEEDEEDEEDDDELEAADEDEEDEDEEEEEDEDEDDEDEDDDDVEELEAEDEEDDEPKKKKKKEKVKKKPSPPAKGTISYTVYSYLTNMENKKPSFEAIQRIVKKRHPDSKFNEGHLNWYRNHFVKNIGAEINMPLESAEDRKERLQGQLKKARGALKEKNPIMYAKTLPKKERKAFINELDPKTRKQVLRALAEIGKPKEEEIDDEEEEVVVSKKKKKK